MFDIIMIYPNLFITLSRRKNEPFSDPFTENGNNSKIRKKMKYKTRSYFFYRANHFV